MSIIFRVENADGGGMYNGMKRPEPRGDTGDVRRPLESKTHDWADEPRFTRGVHFFGFTSLRQAAEWIADEDWLDDLIGEGYIIGIYRVTDAAECVVLKAQCFFPRQEATLVSVLGLHTIRREVVDEQETDVDAVTHD